MIARSPDEVRNYVTEQMAIGAVKEITTGERGAIIGRLNRYLGGDDNRKLALAWLFSHDDRSLSTKELDNDQWHALIQWIGFWHDDDGWHVDERFPVECVLILNIAAREYGLSKPSEKDPELKPDEMVVDAVSQLGGMVTNVSDDNGEWSGDGNVAVPDEAIRRVPRIVKKPPRVFH
jgi:hypothetical protein